MTEFVQRNRIAWLADWMIRLSTIGEFEYMTLRVRLNFNRVLTFLALVLYMNIHFLICCKHFTKETGSNQQSRFCKNSEIDPLISKRLSVENKVKLSQLTRGRFCNNSENDTLISKRLSVENKAKLSQLTRSRFCDKSEIDTLS